MAAGTALAKSRRMIDPIFQTDNYQLARKLLDAAALRQEAIASNVANAETPGYHRLDVAPDFAQQLKASVEQGGVGAAGADLRPQLAEDQTARSLRPDGNTVEISVEQAQFGQAAAEYQTTLNFLENRIGGIRKALKGE